MKRYPVLVAVLILAGAISRQAGASDLYGSRFSMERQHAVAVDLQYDFAQTASQVAKVVADGGLARVEPNADFEMSGVSFPYARPEVRAFIERLAAEYHAATGSMLVVTSLTRPVSQQPRNASPLSVHPAGMAVDLRVPATKRARDWLAQKLLELEGEGVLDVTLERKPAHLHIAVFPASYAQYAAGLAPLPSSGSSSHTLEVVTIIAQMEMEGMNVSYASANLVFIAVAAGAMLTLVATIKRRSAAAFAQLRLDRRRETPTR